jgi:hypothetical protein
MGFPLAVMGADEFRAAIRGSRQSPSAELGDLAELELDRRLPAEDVDQHLELELVLVDLDDLAGEVGEGTLADPHGLADLVLQAGLGPGGDLLLGALGHQEGLDVLAGQRGRLGPLAHEPGHARRVADDKPGGVVQLGPDQQVAGEHLALGDDPLAVLEVDVILHGDHDLVHGLLGVHRVDAGLEVLLDLLLVARLGVDHEPPARPGVRVVDDGGRLHQELLFREHLGVVAIAGGGVGLAVVAGGTRLGLGLVRLGGGRLGLGLAARLGGGRLGLGLGLVACLGLGLGHVRLVGGGLSLRRRVYVVAGVRRRIVGGRLGVGPGLVVAPVGAVLGRAHGGVVEGREVLGIGVSVVRTHRSNSLKMASPKA